MLNLGFAQGGYFSSAEGFYFSSAEGFYFSSAEGFYFSSAEGFYFSSAQETPTPLESDTSFQRPPVLLVPGWMGRALDMMALKERLVRDGWDPRRVFPLEFVDPVGSSVDHALELREALEVALTETGARQVDIVAHSMGGLALWVLLQQGGPPLPINRAVFLATPFQGTVTAHLAWGEGGPEMIPGSEFLTTLQNGGWPTRWVNSLAIKTPLDLTVVPGYGAELIGVEDSVICCPTHQGLLDHEETYLVVREFLLHGRTGAQGEGP
jgi:triacylglycerol lipase